MAHFAFICVPAHGHINPMAALAREFGKRGHTTTFLHHPDVASMVCRTLDFVPVGARKHPSGSLAQALNRAGRVRGPFGLMPVIRDLARATAMLCEELPQVLRALSVDMIITDQVEAAGGLVAYHLGLPFVSVAAALPLNWEADIPSPFVGWSFGETRWHRYRNIVGAFAAQMARGPIGDVIESFSVQWRLGRGRRIEHYLSGLAQISQLTRSLDFPRRSLIRCFHYCGPLRERKSEIATCAHPSGSRRAFASLGTLQGHRIQIFDQISRAVAACGFHLTIAHGGCLSNKEVARLSRRAEVHDFVSQEHVLAETDVAIVHGGLNTVLDALAQGVPLILMPLAYEQGAIAARVLRSGAGRRWRFHVSPTKRLTELVREVAEDPSYAESARGLQREIRAAGGVSRAADIVEHVLGTGLPFLNAEAFLDEPHLSA